MGGVGMTGVMFMDETLSFRLYVVNLLPYSNTLVAHHFLST
jgi:hypothetical protein